MLLLILSQCQWLNYFCEEYDFLLILAPIWYYFGMSPNSKYYLYKFMRDMILHKSPSQLLFGIWSILSLGGYSSPYHSFRTNSIRFREYGLPLVEQYKFWLHRNIKPWVGIIINQQIKLLTFFSPNNLLLMNSIFVSFLGERYCPASTVKSRYISDLLLALVPIIFKLSLCFIIWISCKKR